MKNRKTGKQNGPVAGMSDRDAPENSPVAAGEAKCPAGTGEEINMVQETRASDSPAVQKLIEELTVAGEDDAFAGQRKTPDPAVSGEGVSGGEGQPDPLKQAEEELVKNARSERSRERIRSIIAARRDAESRLEYYETAVRRFRQMLSDTGMDMGDIAATLHYGKLVASGDPHLMHCALDILNHERGSLCRRLGIAEPGVDLFADVPEIREAVERRELKMEHALRLAIWNGPSAPPVKVPGGSRKGTTCRRAFLRYRRFHENGGSQPPALCVGSGSSPEDAENFRVHARTGLGRRFRGQCAAIHVGQACEISL